MAKLSAVILLTFLLAIKAFAGAPNVSVASVLSVVSGYQDSNYYKAVLVKGEEDADLYLFSRDGWDLILEAYAPGIVVTGIGGTDASLSTAENGALRVHSENIAIGRNRWQQTLTIVHRDGQYVVAGYTYSFYDTLAVDANGDVLTGECDVNLLTGKGFKDSQPFRTNLRSVPVTKWRADMAPPECEWE
ncbi:hypothetical protein [Roseibium alexandrii]|uniref:hypothetical protein n=1 Tax=Roseibium alexandrii TaxID=388408 RepID=UPI0037519151